MVGITELGLENPGSQPLNTTKRVGNGALDK